MEVKDILRKARKEHGLSQRQLGEKIGANPVLVSNWERGARIPSQDTIDKIASALKMDTREKFKFKTSLGYRFSSEEVLSFTRGILLDIVAGKPIDIIEHPLRISIDSIGSEEQKPTKMSANKLVAMMILTDIIENENDTDVDCILRMVSAYVSSDEHGKNLMADVCETVGKKSEVD